MAKNEADERREYSSTKDISLNWGVSERTVRNLVQRGVLTPYRVGRQLRFNPAEVEAAFRREAAAR
ncbi:hypothetical protein GCM10027449_18440 [Sinomonas notoginsengisoli]|uniref:helix-turn-helix domain-containing protein n=1 Tax=Sinomonas notoginsengisoli TaxID=1457311 RepID=UPI001F44B1E0|nr:helix-turn-helix domain-containing protein [Sinomonas notoginsengisoli]